MYKLSSSFTADVKIPAIGTMPEGKLEAVFLIATDELDKAHHEREAQAQESLGEYTKSLLEISNDKEASNEAKQLRVQGISLTIISKANATQQDLMRSFLSDRLVGVNGAESDKAGEAMEPVAAKKLVLNSSLYRSVFFAAYTQAANDAIAKN